MSRKILKKDKCVDGPNELIEDIGIVIHEKYPFFGYSPDGVLIEGDEFVLIEIKSLKLGTEKEGNAFLRSLKFLREENGKFMMRPRCVYYGQIQFGLAMMSLKKAYLVLYVEVKTRGKKNESNMYIEVPIDKPFIDTMFSTLEETYFKFCLPFLYKNKDQLIK